MTEDTSSHGRDGVPGSNYGRRRFIAVGSGVGAALLAGCTSDDGGNGNGDGGNGGGSGGGDAASFRLLVSDAPADIGDFDRLDVTFSKARVFEGGDGEETETEGTDAEGTENGTDTENGTENETSGEMTETVEEDEQTNETDDENGTATETENETDSETETDTEDDDGEGGEGFYVLELDSPTVDLTQVVGDKAQPIFEGELEAGSYQKLELHVEDVEGIVDGEEVEVKVPSNKLQLTKPFEVTAGEELDFVFDINVVKRGNQASYNLKPVISQSGVRGKDVEVEEVGEDGEGDGSEDGAGENASDDEGGAGDADDETDDSGGAGNETGGAGNETGGNESAA